MNKEEARKKIEKWLMGIPKSERDVPYFEIPRRDGSQMVSPQQAMDELSKNQRELNYIAKHIIDQLDPETDTELESKNAEMLIEEQIKSKLNSMTEEEKNRPFIMFWDGSKPLPYKELVKTKRYKQIMLNYYQHLIRKLSQ